MAHMAIKEGTLSIAQVPRADIHRGGVDGDAGDRLKQPKRLTRRDTLGVETMKGQNRQSLVDRVHAEGVHEVNIDSGQTGNVYALEVGGQKIAVFKPTEGEHFSRKSLGPGQGALREEAVYLVDRLSGSQAGVPVTSRASIKVDGEELLGSVQAFVGDTIGFIEDFAMPRNPDAAEEFVRKETAEALAMLDMRAFNMDRHTGNLLVLRKSKPHGLGAIDHGCCLPPWWLLSEANFDAWFSWPQLKSSPCQASREAARVAYGHLPEICSMVHSVGLDAPSILTLRLCTLFVYVGVAELNLPCGHLAALMLRDEEKGFQDLSWLEQKVLTCAVAAGAKCRMQVNDRDDQELVLDDGGDGLEEGSFLAGLEGTFRSELPAACEAVGNGSYPEQ
eukprot:CAMPEP_0168366054 /NCGR_PEP_ID=MMETSP0228-20121227/5031_1 /TAXON_ID=133427 /ORGANISM="Protoceratium reticulatum, Strain CCCM 535 (=CCMP 1889)" /LENGTH=389 /DNA_ID=CAMNT_0008378845 /DNA_START=1 /DNA_END=1170 /DNA_ORIENTATION=-